MSTANAVTMAPVVVVSCDCGMYPLERAAHRTPMGAWRAASAHVALNPELCTPNMRRVMTPLALLPPT